jgi:hypothetical protein
MVLFMKAARGRAIIWPSLTKAWPSATKRATNRAGASSFAARAQTGAERGIPAAIPKRHRSDARNFASRLPPGCRAMCETRLAVDSAWGYAIAPLRRHSDKSASSDPAVQRTASQGYLHLKCIVSHAIPTAMSGYTLAPATCNGLVYYGLLAPAGSSSHFASRLRIDSNSRRRFALVLG